MKIQPIDNRSYDESVNSDSPVAVKPVLKSRLKRLFDRQFPSVLKNNSEKVNEVKDGEFEPSSVCLAKMVQNFIEDAAAPEKPKCGRNRCNCFNGNINDVSDDEFDLSAAGYFGDSVETLKSLIPCASVIQRNLLADTSKIVEKNKTGNYKAILQSLPYIFVGEADRLQQILSIVTEAAKLSLKKKGMHVPPWRKFEYMRSKWLSPHTRAPPPPPSLLPPTPPPTPDANAASKQIFAGTEDKSVPASECGDFEMIFGEEAASFESKRKSDDGLESPAGGIWEPPAIKPRNVERGSKLVVTGLASLFS